MYRNGTNSLHSGKLFFVLQEFSHPALEFQLISYILLVSVYLICISEN